MTSYSLPRPLTKNSIGFYYFDVLDVLAELSVLNLCLLIVLAFFILCPLSTITQRLFMFLNIEA